MLGLLVFVASFLFLFSITMIFPDMQPGKILCDVLGNSETNNLIAGVSGELLIAAMINGLVWGIIIVIVYSYLRGPPKGKVTMPIWVPGYTTSRSSTIEHKSPKQYDEHSFQRIRKTQDVETIEGIGYIYGHKLRKIGIKTVDDLIHVGSTRTGRNYLAKNIGVTPSTILNWIHQAEARR
jgi:hypothetical protein